MGLPIFGSEIENDPKPSEGQISGLLSLILTLTEQSDPQPTPVLSQRPRNNPGGFTQFLLMVMGFEVVLQHRTMGERVTKTKTY